MEIRGGYLWLVIIYLFTYVIFHALFSKINYFWPPYYILIILFSFIIFLSPIAKTKCRIVVFDCFVFGVVPVNIADRTSFFPYCLGSTDETKDGKKDTEPFLYLIDDGLLSLFYVVVIVIVCSLCFVGKTYISYSTLLKVARLKYSPTYLKMDIEGMIATIIAITSILFIQTFRYSEYVLTFAFIYYYSFLLLFFMVI